MIGSIRIDGTSACMTLPGATDTAAFLSYVDQVLCPTLRQGDIVIMDNLSPHKNQVVIDLIEGKGACALFLPPLFTGSQPY